jgi:hypothetical protein
VSKGTEEDGKPDIIYINDFATPLSKSQKIRSKVRD